MSYVEHARELDLPPCKHCGAAQGKPCRTPKGVLTYAHVNRNPWTLSNDDYDSDALTVPAPEEHW